MDLNPLQVIQIHYIYLEYPERRGELVDLGRVEHEVLLESSERRLQVGPVLLRDETPQAVHQTLQVGLEENMYNINS